ncbi:MAG: type II secretion system protein [Planctomycetota bacterium]
MTLETGNSKALNDQGMSDQGIRYQGFTLVELLIVIGIIVVLMALLTAVGSGLRQRAKEKKAESLLKRIELALADYHGNTAGYPPDGIDSKVVTANGTPLTSAAALTYAIILPLKRTQRLPTGQLRVIGIGEPLLAISDSELTPKLEDDELAREIIDPWGQPLHYDNLEGGKGSYNVQSDGDVHLQEPDSHQLDPREEHGGAVSPGPQNINRFDLWSHGKHGHTEDEVVSETIGNWRLAKEDG